nr:(Fe-S)-binding protein [uncultured Dorea sp.]
MKNKNIVETCTHCHACQNQCVFLKKYGIDIGDIKRLNELAYHCFLCGKCTEVCPEKIDGRAYILNLRKKKVEEADGNFTEKGYGMLLKEKKDYIYRNYRHAQGRSVLFPGCNFPSFYPKTTKKLVNVLKSYGIGVAYDCCGKPVAELGLEADEKRIINRIDRELKTRKIKEVIMLCPNCYAYLKPRLTEVKITSIYEKLEELGIGKKNLTPAKVFLPCPDREKKELLSQIEAYASGGLTPVGNVQCCGLGGCAPVKEPELAKNMGEALNAGLKDRESEKIYSYCASCAGNLNRNGCKNVTHVLTEIMGTHEKADTGKSMLNRIKTKFI